MKSSQLAVVFGAIATTNAHYIFPEVFHDGVDYGHWQHVRFHGDPKSSWNIFGDDIRAKYIYTEEDAKSVDNRCGVNQQFANSTLPVKAGDTLGWYVNYKAYPTTGNQDGIYHPGPLTIWMGKVPEGKTAMNWEGDGKSWFKIYEDFPISRNDKGVQRWPNTDVQKLPFVIPKNTPDGDYLFRIEHLNVDSLQPLPYEPQAQLYISCAQISVSGGGIGTPGPLTTIPGHYEYSDPIFHESTYPGYYTPGKVMAWDNRVYGPAVWNGS